MYLSKFTDYSFRILIYLGNHPNELFTVDELSDILGLSTHHIKKIVYKLAKNNYILSTKGRNGGIKLVMDPKDINLGQLLDITEDNLNIVECFSKENNTCNLTKRCKLKPILNESLISFKNKLSEYTLQDIL
ncbi:MAG: RrF2 family transcriptional regulator [Paraclostridium dentum]|uniref:HTH-type transcriptional regulator NsrR n=1 Tax=Paraclostridium bifermentans TaxID=1490 RepID=A0A5P3X7V2_PARBF|nr:Rrf2 family transcriptional regulator [Paraclostridium bifermentans]QEZ67398.1 Rrf2 family transcriptional regulator [Paraclostridium bifermentans]